MSNQLTIPTRKCMHCGNAGFVFPVWHEDYARYMNGAKVQDAFPNMPAALREQIKTGIHPECWDEIFPEEEEDDDDQSTETS